MSNTQQAVAAIDHHLDDDVNTIPLLFERLADIEDSLCVIEPIKFVRPGGEPKLWPVWHGKDAYTERLKAEKAAVTTRLNSIILHLVLSARGVPSVDLQDPTTQKQMTELDARRTQSSAAQSLQRGIQTHIARKQFIETRKASVVIQSFCRGRLACKRFNQLRRMTAAIKIEKLQNLESENKVFRQPAVSMTPNKFLLRSKSILQDLPSVLDDKPQKSLNEKQVENQELLIKCIAQHIGFSGDRPIAACIIYKCLLQWGSFEVERTTVFDRIIQTIGQAIEKSQDNNDILAYCLSNASTLLLLLQRTLKASGATAGSSDTLFGRVNNSFRGVPQGVTLPFVNGNPLSALDAVSQVEAKYPALLFKQQLTAYVEKIYGMIRDNLKKEISPLLGLCIQAPRTSQASLVKGASRSVDNAAQQALIAHWQGIVKGLGDFLSTLKINHVPPILIRTIFTQIFSFINVQLFNSLLLRRECCSFSNSEYVKAGLAELRDWCHNATDEYAGPAWEELKHIRQAVEFLVIHQKPKKTLEEISRGLCPVLSVQQLYSISTMYWDDEYGTQSVSPDVISSMRVMMTEENNARTDSFLLDDDDSSIPFSVDDVSKSMKQIEISDVDPPPIIRDNSGFSFLLPRAD